MDECIDAQHLKTFSDFRIHILTSFVFYYGKLYRPLARWNLFVERNKETENCLWGYLSTCPPIDHN